MVSLVAFYIVLLFGAYLVCLGSIALLSPARARRFLLGFATTPTLHWVELGLRVLAGAAFVANASAMRHPEVFAGLGWVLLLTTAVLMLIPWRWHRQFAQRSVPRALEFLPLIGVTSILLGGVIFFAALA
jgi:hypothetical protein